VISVFGVDPFLVLPAAPGGSWWDSKPRMVGQLDLHRPLDQPLGQLAQQTARADHLLLGPRADEQLVNHPVREQLPQPVTELDLPLLAARNASASLRSPYGLTPRHAGATRLLGRL
jgi:hypothetical protein